jgi:hypothetical protein
MPKIASEVRGDCLGRRLGRLGMVGVAIPARNERDEIPGALHAVVRALEHPSLGRARRVIVVANDGSEDDTGDRARRCLRGIGEVLDGNFGSAGEARGAALERLVAIAGDLSPEEVWFATTDADSRVPPSWLAGQVRWWRDGADAVAGMVAPIWGGDAASAGLRARYEAMMAERGIGPSHPHVYGANLGFTAEIYLAGAASLRSPTVRIMPSSTRCGPTVPASCRWRTIRFGRALDSSGARPMGSRRCSPDCRAKIGARGDARHLHRGGARRAPTHGRVLGARGRDRVLPPVRSG